jgi:transcriptional regulator with XRE-family HTH domain
MGQWADRINALAEGMRVSLPELADLVGVDAATVWRWSKGGDPPSGPTRNVVAALEAILANGKTEALFKAKKAHRLEPRTRELMELIFSMSSRGKYQRWT